MLLGMGEQQKQRSDQGRPVDHGRREDQDQAGWSIGVLSALVPELGAWNEGQDRIRDQGLELIRSRAAGGEVVACAAGVGKVAAAQGAAVLLAQGIGSLWIVGTCGGLRAALPPGTLVHCSTAIQADLAVRDGRASTPDQDLQELWGAVEAGTLATFLTADRPVLSPWRRFKLRRAWPGLCVADMETAAAAAVAAKAGIPWAAARTVTDSAGYGAGRTFQRNLQQMAGRAADTLPSVLARLDATGQPPRP